MPARFITLSLGIVLLGAIAAACGGGGDGEALTLEEYFQQLDRLSQDADSQFESLQEELDRAFATVESDEEFVEAYRDFFDGSQVVLAGFIEGFKRLTPPTAIEDAHREFTEASADVFEPLRSASDQLADVSSQAEMDQILGTFDTDPRFERFDKACLDLQAIADENSIAVDLNCELE